jgi:phosphoglycolate phosphatase
MSVVVAFDLDGTLVDSVNDLAKAVNGALVDVGARVVDVDDVRSFVGDGAAVLIERALCFAGADPALHATALGRFKAHYERDLVGATQPFAGIEAALDAVAAAGHVLAVATNKPGVFARPLVDAVLPGRFACVVGPDDAGAHKPDPRMLRHVEQVLQRRVGVYVGDSGVDVDVARAASVPVVGVAWGLRPLEVAGADVVVHHPRDLPQAIARLLG